MQFSTTYIFQLELAYEVEDEKILYEMSNMTMSWKNVFNNFKQNNFLGKLCKKIEDSIEQII